MHIDYPGTQRSIDLQAQSVSRALNLSKSGYIEVHQEMFAPVPVLSYSRTRYDV